MGDGRGRRACGTTLDRGRATALADRLVTAGRAGGPRPDRVPPHLAEVWADRDLTAHAHRAAYTGLAATVAAGIDGLAEALYERLLRRRRLAAVRRHARHAARRCTRPACRSRWSATSASTCARSAASWASPTGRRVRALLRGRPLQARPGDLPERVRGAGRRPGAHADGRRHPGRRGARSTPAAGCSCCRPARPAPSTV